MLATNDSLNIGSFEIILGSFLNIKPQLKMNNSTTIEKMRSINQLLDSWLYSKEAVSNFQQFFK